MNTQKFLIYLISVSILMAAALSAMHFSPQLQEALPLSWVSYIYFNIFSVLIFYFADKSLKSKDKNRFSQVFLVATVAKMLLSLVLFLVFFLVIAPKSKYFVLPFLLVYTAYTAFEVFFMTRLARE